MPVETAAEDEEALQLEMQEAEVVGISPVEEGDTTEQLKKRVWFQEQASKSKAKKSKAVKDAIQNSREVGFCADSPEDAERLPDLPDTDLLEAKLSVQPTSTEERASAAPQALLETHFPVEPSPDGIVETVTTYVNEPEGEEKTVSSSVKTVRKIVVKKKKSTDKSIEKDEDESEDEPTENIPVDIPQPDEVDKETSEQAKKKKAKKTKRKKISGPTEDEQITIADKEQESLDQEHPKVLKEIEGSPEVQEEIPPEEIKADDEQVLDEEIKKAAQEGVSYS